MLHTVSPLSPLSRSQQNKAISRVTSLGGGKRDLSPLSLFPEAGGSTVAARGERQKAGGWTACGAREHMGAVLRDKRSSAGSDVGAAACMGCGKVIVTVPIRGR
jgi:hypothetical protein